MNIRYASDLHVSLNEKYFNVPEEYIIKKLNLDNIDLLILAGDTDEYPQNLTFCSKLLSLYPKLQIIEVAGNHTYYKCFSMSISMNEIDKRCREFSEIEPRYHYLNNDYIIINDIKFIGSTMWTDLGGHFGRVVKIVQCLNDYRYILNDNLHTVFAKDIIECFNKSVKYIVKELNNYNGKSIVITHHAPFIDYSSCYYNNISHAFSVDLLEEGYLDDLYKIPYKWIFGHTHINEDASINTVIGGIDCICNQFGYKGESEQGSQFNAWKTYDENKLIQI